MRKLVPTEPIERIILLIRGQKVILDADLARLYGVTTKRFNEAFKRNRHRFPGDFAFQLTAAEFANLRSQFATSSPQLVDSLKDNLNWSQFATSSSRHRGSVYRPWAFTEHGALMAANILRSDQAVQISVFVVRAFVRLRQLLATHKELAAKLAELERKVRGHDEHIRSLFDTIHQLMAPPEVLRRRIGFRSRDS